jgi:quinoprotein glucose dehydrogenase
MNKSAYKNLLLATLPLAITAGLALTQFEPNTNWTEYNGDGHRSHYSPLTQITEANVQNLQVAWSYTSGGADTVRNSTQMQCNPIIIDGVLYGVSADIQAFAINAATGQELWKTSIADNGGTLSRGVTYWTDGREKVVFFGAGRWLHALDAKTGQPMPRFGQNGRLDLLPGVQRSGADEFIRANTPSTVYKDMIIVGARVSENQAALLGDIRAFDVRTGRLVWTFRTIPAPGDYGYDTWKPAKPRERLGGANAWAGMAIDRERGIIYAPTGSAAFDFYGGDRKGDNLFANCLIALDANTGKRLWHYQLVHHDIWDRDPPTTPNLLTVTHKGPDGRPRRIDAVAQITKQGQVFVFDRVTGKPLFDIKETPFPQDAMTGDEVSPTQPIPQKPAPFTRQTFTEKDINPWAADREAIAARLRGARTGSPYIPLTSQMTVFFPGTDGGAQWGGAATDPAGTIYIPAKEVPCYSSLVPRKKSGSATVTSSQLYVQNCAACHGEDRKGSHDGAYPSMLAIGERLPEASIRQVLKNGRGMMPAFSHLSEAEHKALMDFLLNKTSGGPVEATLSQSGEIMYQNTGYNRWYDANGYPVGTPPLGTLTAIDLNTGEHRWQVPLGEYPELTEKGIAPTGTDNYGCPLVTGSGLLFIAATKDEKIRAIDTKTGKTLWEGPLPAAGYASPSTYSVNGRQYVVIACGGGKLKTKSSDKYVAFALP